jgi:hypothetical protein
MDVGDEGTHVQDVKTSSVHVNPETEKESYIDSNENMSKDFSNIMLNGIIYKLNKILGFETLLLFSESGEFIYLLIRATEEELRILAQDQDHPLALNLGFSDFSSLDP